jgi:pyruvate carboxylase
VKTNIPFLVNLVTHPEFLAGKCTTRFIDETPTLFDFPIRKDRATKVLEYLADVIVNGNPLVKGRPAAVRRQPAPLPAYDRFAPRRPARGRSSRSSAPRSSPPGSATRSG